MILFPRDQLFRKNEVIEIAFPSEINKERINIAYKYLLFRFFLKSVGHREMAHNRLHRERVAKMERVLIVFLQQRKRRVPVNVHDKSPVDVSQLTINWV